MLRRYSLLLSTAAGILALFVAYTYVHRAASERQHPPNPVTRIPPGLQATATAFRWGKDDPQTNCPIVRATAASYEAIQEPSTFELKDMRLRLYNKGCSWYTYVQTSKAEFDEWSGVMTAKGDALIIMKVPAGKEPGDQQATANLVHVRTSSIHYETKTGKVDTNAPAAFQFANGSGHSVGADYDPTTHDLHMKSQVSLDWLGHGPAANAMHIEAGELRYEEDKGKVYLSPWSRLKRHNTVINAAASEVTLADGVLQQVDSLDATGTDQEESRRVEYGAKRMVALFNDDGDMTQITASPEARLLSTEAASKTSVTANKAVLKFDIQPETVNGEERHSSILHQALATGNAIVDSSPVLQPGVKPADTRILRSQSIQLEMRPGGREIQSLRTDAPGQLEFKPNQPDRAHRWMDGERIQIAYGDANAIDSFHATKVTTRTEKPLPQDKRIGKNGKPAPPLPPALTWSDGLTAKFAPNSSDLTTLEQKGNFRYEEGLRHASSASAFLEQSSNKITLTGAARVWDDTGSTLGDTILLDQQNGDMDATGNVASTRQPDQQKGRQKSSLLDQSQPLQARADKMLTRDNNLNIHYDGHAVLWQGANRLQADLVVIDRDEETLHATGHVISQLVDNQNNDTAPQTAAAQGVRLEPVVEKTPPRKKKTAPPIFTVVHAPELFYRDDQRLAHYTGGVTLLRDQMTVTSKELRAFLTQDDANKDKERDSGTSLDHAFADGDVKVVQTTAGRTRTGTSDHCEYYPKDSKVILNGGLAKMADTRKGTTVGQQLTYYSSTDHVIVEGKPKQPVVTDMNRRRN